MEERLDYFEKRKKEYHDLGFLKLDKSGNIIKIKKNLFIKNLLKMIVSKKDIDIIFKSKDKIKKIKKLVKKIYINLYNNKHRAAHPEIFSIFYKELQEEGLVYKYISNSDTIELEFKDGTKIRQQIQECFKIYDKFMLEDLEKLSFDFYKSSQKYDFIVIEEKVCNLNSDKFYIDMVIKISDYKKLYIEINEDHHDLEIDNNRNFDIYLKNNTLPISIYKDNIDIDEIMIKIWKQISFGLFETNKIDALTIYLNKVDNFDLGIIRFFVTIHEEYKDSGIPLIKLQNFLINKFNYNKKKFKSFFKNSYQENDINDDDFVNKNDCELNLIGFHTFLMLFKEKDFKGARLIKNQYGKFTEKYQDLIIDMMSGQNEIILMLKKHAKKSKIHSKINFFCHSIIQKIINKLELESRFHNNTFLLKTQKENYIIKEETRKLFDKELFEYIQNVNERKNKFINFAFINETDYLEINKALDDYFEERQLQSDTDSDFSEEELIFESN